jgi:hypothetical protein
MNSSIWIRAGALATGLGAAPLAMAQPMAVTPSTPWIFVAMMAAFGMLFLLGIFLIGSFKESSAQRQKLAMIERLVASGQQVPRELLMNGPQQLPLPEERRRDIRRGITLLSLGIAVALVPIIGSGGEWRYGVWGLLFLVPALGSFLKAHLTAREIARGASNGAPQR